MTTKHTMKPVVAGVVIGSAVALYLSMLYLYSLWLPVTALAVLVSGLIGLAFGARIKPALLVSAALVIVYLCVFWIPPEMSVRTANTPEEHFRATRAIGSRAQIFGDHERELEQYKLAAQGDHPEATFVLGAYYDYGYNSFRRDESEVVAHYRRAAELGYQDQNNRLGQLTEKR
jgi:hypothetical protein